MTTDGHASNPTQYNLTFAKSVSIDLLEAWEILLTSWLINLHQPV